MLRMLMFIAVLLPLTAASGHHRPAHGLPNGWTEQCVFRNNYLAKEVKTRPTIEDHERWTTEFGDMIPTMTQKLQLYKSIAAEKAQQCENAMISLECSRAVWKAIKEDQINSIATSRVGDFPQVTKPKYMRYLQVRRMGGTDLIDIDQYLKQEQMDVEKHNCDHKVAQWDEAQFEEGGYHYKRVAKILRLEDEKLQTYEWRTYAQDLDLHAGTWCWVVKRFHEDIVRKLGPPAANTEYNKVDLEKSRSVTGDTAEEIPPIKTGLSDEKVRMVRDGAAVIFQKVVEACTPSKAEARSTGLSCSLLNGVYPPEYRARFGDGHMLRRSADYVQVCQSVFFDKGMKLGPLCARKFPEEVETEI